MYIYIVIMKLISLYSILILINILGSWIDPRKEMGIFNIVRKVTDPYLNLFRIVVPIGNMGIDMSGIIGLLILRLMEDIVSRIFSVMIY